MRALRRVCAPRRVHRRRAAHGAHFSWPAALLPGTFAALCDETIQLFVPGRSGQITDVWLDTAGYLTGALLTLLLFRLCRKRPKQRKTP